MDTIEEQKYHPHVPTDSPDSPDSPADSPPIDHKIDLLALTNGWNDKNERIIISIGENAASYKWMHEKSSSYYKMVSTILNITLILFSTGLSAETILPSSNNLAVDIVRRVFTYIVTFLSVLQNFLKYGKLSEKHKSSAMAFSELYHDIQQQMCMYRRDRHNATSYVTTILKQYDTIVLNAPNMDARIVKQFKATFKNSDISVPDIADRIQKIEIVSESIGTNAKSRDIGIGIGLSENNFVVSTDQSKRYGRYGFCNLQQVHNAFQIHGDISDNDIQNASPIELRDLRTKYLQEKSNYEYNRYIQHTPETE
jgi:hypothetical protein